MTMINGEIELRMAGKGMFIGARVTSGIDVVWVDVVRAHFLHSSRHVSRGKNLKDSIGLC